MKMVRWCGVQGLPVPAIAMAVAIAVVLLAGSLRQHVVLAQSSGPVSAQNSAVESAAKQYPRFTLQQRIAIQRAVEAQKHPDWGKMSPWEALQRFLALLAPVGSSSVAPSANFGGNLTTIDAGAGNALGMIRTATCSLTAYSASYSLNLPSVSAALVGETTNYDQVLHNEAGLTTTGGTWPAGCGNQTLGVTAQEIVYLGETTGGYYVFAGAFNGTEVSAVALDASGTGTATVTELTDGATPTLVAAADLNGDGNTDLVAVNQPAVGANGPTGLASISVFLGNADGTFQSATTYALPGVEGASAVVDAFTGNGIPDIVASSYTDTAGVPAWQLTFLAGNGDGTFQAPQNVTVTPPASVVETGLAYAGLISADVRGNGTKDLVTAEGIVLLGNGNGTFTQLATTAFPNISVPEAGPNVAAADYNNDGKQDLAVDDGVTISVYLGDGTGNFTPDGSYATIDNAGFLAANDLDGDGNVDLYTGLSRNGIFAGDQYETGLAYALMGQGSGSFAGAPVLPFAYTGANLIPLKTGSTTLTGIGLNETLNSTNVSVTAYTLNTNGSSTTGPTTTLSPLTIGGNTYAFQSFGSFGFGDFNSDGNTDMIVALPGPIANGLNPYWGFYLLTGNGDGTFNTPTLVPLPNLVPGGATDTGANVISLLVADVNGDGKPDLVYSYTDTAFATQVQYAGIAVQLGNGDGTFQAPQTIQTYSGAGGVTGEAQTPVYLGAAIAGGHLDLFAIQTTLSNQVLTNTLVMYPGNGDGTFGAATTPPTADNIELPVGVVGQMALADMNGDGKPDLVTLGEANSGTQGEIAVSLGNGDGTFQTPIILDFGSGPTLGDSIAVADFNGDGKLDVAVGGFNPPVDTGIFFGNGDGTLQSFNAGNGLVEPAQGINFVGDGAALATHISGGANPDLILGRVVLINKGVSTSTLTPTTTALAASATSITAGQNVTFTATVSASSTPSGTVTFMDGTTALGTGTLNSSGVATYSTTSLAVGSHSITAAYGGNSTFAASTSAATVVTVTAPALAATTTTLTASATSVTSGTSVTFNATVAPASGTGTPTGTVTFMEGTTTLGTGTLAGGMASYSTTSLAVGANSVTAVYGGDSNYAGSTSTAVTVTVTAVTPTFSIAASPTSGTVNPGQSTQTTITVTPAGGFSSQVSFACSGLPTGGSCSFSPSTVTPSGTTAATTTLTIATAAQSSLLAWPVVGSHAGSRAGAALAVLLGGFLWVFGRRKGLSWMRILPLLLVLLTIAAIAVGCGGSNGSGGGGGGGGGSTPQTYTVTVTGTAGTENQTATFSLTVQ